MQRRLRRDECHLPGANATASLSLPSFLCLSLRFHGAADCSFSLPFIRCRQRVAIAEARGGPQGRRKGDDEGSRRCPHTAACPPSHCLLLPAATALPAHFHVKKSDAIWAPCQADSNITAGSVLQKVGAPAPWFSCSWPDYVADELCNHSREEPCVPLHAIAETCDSSRLWMDISDSCVPPVSQGH